MAEQDLIRLACENVEAYNVGNWQRLKALLAPDVVYHEVGSQRRLQGADQLIEAYQGWKQFAPNGMGTVTKALTSGNSVALEVTWTGTHTGSLVGQAAPSSLWQVVVIAGRSADNFPGR